MFTKTADYYDRIYAQFKDYEKEVRQLREIIERGHPAARTILDVACGTGRHGRILRERYGYQITGVDLSEDFIRLARAAFPEGEFHRADMRDFSLDRQFDVVMCLFSSIGYVRTPEAVVRTLENFRRHLADPGLLIVEPWFTPEGFTAGHFSLTTVDDEDLKIARMSYGEREGRLSRFTFEYLIADREGIRRETEIHEAGLFTVAEMKEFFAAAGLVVEHDPVGLFNRGLYIARPV